MLALLVTHEGLPVGYEVFPGATFEGHSLISVLQTMQARYDVRKMIFVADRGMLNEDNLSALDEAGAYYIVGAKLKQLPAALQTKVLDKSAYQADGKGASSAAELTHKKRRLITKHDLKVRPIYHWTPSRVRAHIAISFMAFACIRQLMYRIKLQHKALSPEVIRNALIHVQHSVFKHKRTKQRYVMPAQINPEAKKIYAVMGLKATTTAYPLY